MAHCTKCGAVVAEGAGFCGSCGAAQSGAAGAPVVPATGGAAPAATVSQPGMAENVAGLLCYLVGWITGLIFFLIDKRPYVRFHAAQSIVVFGGLHVLMFVLGMIFGVAFFMGGVAGFTAGWAFIRVLDLLCFILWILLMVKAYQGERFRVPIAADLAEKIFGKS